MNVIYRFERLVLRHSEALKHEYPRCCIEYFVSINRRYRLDREKPMNYDGFIPCPRHLAMLLSREISLNELIVRPTDELIFNVGYFIGGMVIGLIALVPYFYMSNR